MKVNYIRIILITSTLIALFSIGITGSVQADPELPLPRIPICGDQDEGNVVFQCNDFVPTIDVQTFQVPGTGTNDYVFDFVFREATYNNELGFFIVDDPSGSIDELQPGDEGYYAAAFDRAEIIFPSGSTANTPDVTLELTGEDILMFFIVQNNTLENLIANNPNNELNLSPRAFFSLDLLNPDDVDHFVGFVTSDGEITQFGFEDITNGGDVDYDDIVYNIEPPLPSLSFDRDGDALPDDWEINGYDTNLDGERDLDLPEMGADPDVKDIFIRVDWLEVSGENGHSHRPSEEAMDLVREAFMAQDINLHIIYGEAIEETRDLETLLTWIDLGFPEIVDIQLNIEEFTDLREQYLLENGSRPGMGSVFHYAIMGHYITRFPRLCPRYERSRPIGIAISGSDFIVGLQPAIDRNMYTNFLEASTFMHELGHTLGLGHGGISPSGVRDNRNHKPNHLSIMNYAFTREGLIVEGNPGLLDYSQFGSDIIPDLMEDGNLNESIGLNGGSEIEQYGTRWYCDVNDSTGRFTTNANGPIDWNCSEPDNEINVRANINKDTNQIPFVCSEQYDTLTSYNEWDNLDFDHGTIGTFVAVLPEYPTDIIVDEPDLPVDKILGPPPIYLPAISK